VINFDDIYDDNIVNDDLINKLIIENQPLITLNNNGDKYEFKFVTDIIPVEFTNDDIPNVIDYLNLIKKHQNYEKYIDENADKMLMNDVKTYIPNNFTNDKTIMKYIHDYVNAEKYYINFKQNQQSLWHKLGISPILINKECRPIIKINEIDNLSYVIENDIYDSFDEIVYYHYLGSYFTETIYNSNWMQFGHRFRFNHNNQITTYNSNDIVENGIIKFDFWNDVWHNDKKPDLRIPLVFTLKISYEEDVENNLNLGNNTDMMTTIDKSNITRDDNNDLVLSIYKTINIKDNQPFYVYIDSKNHYPFEQGVNATLSLQYNSS
jgi:hypothetical protein